MKAQNQESMKKSTPLTMTFPRDLLTKTLPTKHRHTTSLVPETGTYRPGLREELYQNPELGQSPVPHASEDLPETANFRGQYLYSAAVQYQS